ncbi:hypothetical protein M885DRAFT_520820 [Pelagophyceae sp. CCMP2097]|nr:hypothetical protein M885DRAFT_520820 [Pelagophyceae sp. CCMP2097]
MDRTAEFAQLLVSAVRVVDGAAENGPRAADRPSRKPSAVQRRATQLVTGLGRARQRLCELGVAYASPVHLGDDSAIMSEADRDGLERSVGGFLLDCRAALTDLAGDGALAPHDEAVVQAVLDRAKVLSQTFDALQRLRSTRELEARRSLTAPCNHGVLVFDRPDAKVQQAAAQLSRDETEALRLLRGRAATYAPPVPQDDETGDETADEDRPGAAAAAPHEGRAPEAARAARQQMQMQMQLRNENDVLTTELEGELDAAKRIEVRMESVSQLMGTFSSLVAEQQQTIAGLSIVVDEAAHVLAKGGDELLRASKRKSTFPIFFNTAVVAAAVVLLLLHLIRP